MKSKIWFFMVAVVLLRLAISAVFLHGDLVFIFREPAAYWDNGDISNIADYYPPLAYLLFGLMAPLYWLSERVGYWVLRLPYLAADLVILKLLLSLSSRKHHKRLILLWGLDAVILYGTYAHGQMEIILAALVLWSVWLVREKKTVWTMMALSMAASLKTQSVFLLLPAAIFLARKFWSRLGLLVVGFGLPAGISLIFWKIARFDVLATYFPKVAYPTIEFAMRPDMVVTWLMLAVGLGIYGLLLLKLWERRSTVHLQKDYLSVVLVAFLAMFIANSANLLHRYVLVVPILLLVTVESNWKNRMLFLLYGLLFLGNIYTYPLEWGLIDHLFPQVVSFPATRELVASWIKYEHLALLFRTGANIILSWMAIKSLQCIGNGQVRYRFQLPVR
ncbi:MAG: hypothetical protein UV05_C0042G0004 [candidate division CPR1 bacterium GW2011_GWA2_42_17]|uniref:DUF2029 domain-containing protein n=1 Tax=candidate division CPR1 bacterium GW2011_GWA2_42_17 TaxID=1618341 RepID=A0A0G0Z150_9BACT|nr:MAG: hypothetical protein UV05_C0042G0004 [candidate division CPR1 bacterium GW2011_GWA2_42_17]